MIYSRCKLCGNPVSNPHSETRWTLMFQAHASGQWMFSLDASLSVDRDDAVQEARQWRKQSGIRYRVVQVLVTEVPPKKRGKERAK